MGFKIKPWGQNVSITFQVIGQGRRVSELEPFSYKPLIVSSVNCINNNKE